MLIRLNAAKKAKYFLGGAWLAVMELLPNPNELKPKPTPVHVVIPPLVGGGACRNILRLMGNSSSSGVESPCFGTIT